MKIEEFSLKDEIKKLEENERRELNIIGFFIERKKVDLRSKAQLQVAIKRHLRAAKLLVEFSDNQILRACEEADRWDARKWTIETLVKLLIK